VAHKSKGFPFRDFKVITYSITFAIPSMRILFILTTFLVSHPYFSIAQLFEGKLEYVSYFLNKETLQPIFDGVPETVTIKGAKYRTDVQNAQQGQLEWQIDNYLTGYQLVPKKLPEH
jgi:hypothetical protein